MSPSPSSVPPWLKWTCRGFGALFIAGSLLVLSIASVGLWRLISAHSGPLSGKALMELLSRQAGQLAGGLVLLLMRIFSRRAEKQKE